MRISDWSSDVCSSDLEECRFEAQAGSYDATKGRAAEDAAVDDGDEGAERARAALIGCGTQGVFLAGNGGRGIEYCRHAAPEGDRRDAVAEAEADPRQDAWRHGGQDRKSTRLNSIHQVASLM